MGYVKEFVKGRYEGLMNVIEQAVVLDPGEQVWMKCEEGKSPHTIGQKLREFFKMAGEANPDADIDYRSYSVSVFAESRKICITRKKAAEYNVTIIDDPNDMNPG